MPTLLRVDGLRFFAYTAEPGEPPHVHVAQAGRTAKYWLNPVELARSDGFRAHELGRLRELVVMHEVELRRGWDALHGKPAAPGSD